MKTSNKILLITIFFVLFITLITVISITIFLFSENPHLIKYGKGSNEKISKEYDLHNFNLIDFEGFWKANIIYDRLYKIKLTAPEYLMEYIEIDVFEQKLKLKQSYFTGIPPISIEVSISIPVLKEIISNVSTDIYFTNFDEEKIIIKTSGYSKIKGNNSYIKHLQITGSGIIENDFYLCKVVNSELNLSGSGTTKLNMYGGILNGQVNGNIIVTYKGSISEQNIYASESVKIQKENEN